MKDKFIEAAKLMADPAKSVLGCCSVILRTGANDKLFSLMFRPKGYRTYRTYWFGGDRAQYQIDNPATERKVRDHRVYALLLAAEAHEAFV